MAGQFERNDSRRMHGCVQRSAFRRAGWTLSDDGTLTPAGAIDLETGAGKLSTSSLSGCAVLPTTMAICSARRRIFMKRSPGSCWKSWGIRRRKISISSGIWLRPAQHQSKPGRRWTVAEQVNELRNLQGTGHARCQPVSLRYRATRNPRSSLARPVCPRRSRQGARALSHAEPQGG